MGTKHTCEGPNRRRRKGVAVRSFPTGYIPPVGDPPEPSNSSFDAREADASSEIREGQSNPPHLDRRESPNMMFDGSEPIHDKEREQSRRNDLEQGINNMKKKTHSGAPSNAVIVLGLMAAQNCPWRNARRSRGSKPQTAPRT